MENKKKLLWLKKANKKKKCGKRDGDEVVE